MRVLIALILMSPAAISVPTDKQALVRFCMKPENAKTPACLAPSKTDR